VADLPHERLSRHRFHARRAVPGRARPIGFEPLAQRRVPFGLTVETRSRARRESEAVGLGSFPALHAEQDATGVPRVRSVGAACSCYRAK
jgi:hypothetical protein